MKQQKKDKYPIELCPVCNNPVEDCICEQDYPEQMLLDIDDQNIEDSFNIF